MQQILKLKEFLKSNHTELNTRMLLTLLAKRVQSAIIRRSRAWVEAVFFSAPVNFVIFLTKKD